MPFARIFRYSGLFAVLLLWFPANAGSVGLKPETVKAWDDYIERVDLRAKQRIAGATQFLWTDQDPTRSERMRRGEIVIAPETAKAPQPVPHGLIHDWIAAVFIPNVTLAQVFAVVRDYGRYSKIYRPSAVREPPLFAPAGSAGQEERLPRPLHPSRYFLSAKFWTVNIVCATSSWTRNVGIPSRKALACRRLGSPASGFGETGTSSDEESHYLWRIYTLTRYEKKERRRGVPGTGEHRVEPGDSGFASVVGRAGCPPTVERRPHCVPSPDPRSGAFNDAAASGSGVYYGRVGIVFARLRKRFKFFPAPGFLGCSYRDRAAAWASLVKSPIRTRSHRD